MQEPTTASLDRSAEPLAAAGLSVGIVVSVGVAVVGLVDESWSIATSVGLLGIPSAAVLGWRFGPIVGSASLGASVWLVIKMGALASFGSAFVIGGLVAVGALASGELGGLIVVPLALLYGIPVLVITIPSALVWCVLMRLLTGRRT